jgi:hypothetical protein
VATLPIFSLRQRGKTLFSYDEPAFSISGRKEFIDGTLATDSARFADIA